MQIWFVEVRGLTTVQLLEAGMHFLSSHHWQPWVLAVQLAQSENRKQRSSELSARHTAQFPSTRLLWPILLCSVSPLKKQEQIVGKAREELKRTPASICNPQQVPSLRWINNSGKKKKKKKTTVRDIRIYSFHLLILVSGWNHASHLWAEKTTHKKRPCLEVIPRNPQC